MSAASARFSSPVQRLREVRHLRAVVRRHVRMQQHRLFLGPVEQRFQLFAPRRDAGEIVLDLGGRHAVLDRLDQMFSRCLRACRAPPSRRAERGVLLAAQLFR